MSDFLSGWLKSESAETDKISVKRVYIDINDGNLYDGVLFSQIMYWHGTNLETGKSRLKVKHEGCLWLAKRYEDWHKECRIDAATARKSIDRMVKRGLLIKKVFHFNGIPTTHIRVNGEVFKAKLELICPTVTDGNDTTGQMDVLHGNVSYITETTPENTPESKETSISAVAESTQPDPAKSKPSKSKRQKATAKPRKDCPQDALYEAVELHIFETAPDENAPYDYSGRCGTISGWLSGRIAQHNGKTFGKISAPATPDHVKRFAESYKKHNPNANLPLDPSKFVEAWRRWVTALRNGTDGIQKTDNRNGHHNRTNPIISPKPGAARRDLTPEEEAALDRVYEKSEPELTT